VENAMFVLTAYAFAVFVLCFATIWLLRLKMSALFAVALWTILAPILMQLLNFLLVGYVDPFWKWAATIQAALALVASVAALGVWAALDRGTEPS
jgi:hypothetical protein